MRRIAWGGHRIDRAVALAFTFDGRAMTGHSGDTLASALLANGVRLVGRSFKYHRPRGVVGAGPEEPNALVGLGEGAAHEPNARATLEPMTDGLAAASQNRWPSLERDVGAVNGAIKRLIPAGFYYKTFMWPRPCWEHVYEPAIRQAAGLGRPPEGAGGDRHEHLHARCDALVAGGGVAGLWAALRLGEAGARVILAEQSPWWGGRAPVDGPEIDGRPAAAWVEGAVTRLAAMPNVTIRTSATVSALHDHGYTLIDERLARPGGPSHRLWRVRTRRLMLAAGAIERLPASPGNDRPGVMTASAVRDHLWSHGVAAARTVLLTNNDDAYRTALMLLDAGQEVPAVADVRAAPDGPLVEAVRARGVRVLPGHALRVEMGRPLTAFPVPVGGDGTGGEPIACDAVAASGGWSPAVHLWSQPGGKLAWDEARHWFAPDPARAPIGADGAANVIPAGLAGGGDPSTAGVLSSAEAAARAACDALGLAAPEGPVPTVSEPAERPAEPAWVVPRALSEKLRGEAFVDLQNDVTVADVELAAREGFRAAEHAKRYTTLGMATDQGKLGGLTGLAALSEALGRTIPETGTTTHRPPYVPLGMGAIAGEARGAAFQPVRATPIHAWHEAHGAEFEPVGLWRRPLCYPRPGESEDEAVAREVLNTRARLGILDASTLGKIVVQGRDAGRFLDMLYAGRMSTLAPGRLRYGVMCTEGGFVMDDGVVARLSDHAWLCHTTTGGAGAVHAHMEDWLQTEWHEWDARTLDVTEQWAQVAVAGPGARRALEALGGLDVSRGALPFMRWTEGTLGGLPARVFRVSFSGELGFEVAVPAGHGMALWERLLEVGAPLGVGPYGTEALHVMRAEKGFPMIGDETDGTVTPGDLGLPVADKPDHLGRRALSRTALADPSRPRLVGLEAVSGGVLPEGAQVAGEGVDALGQRRTIGRVTSAYRSPTLGRGIALALIERGPERMGQTVDVPTLEGPWMRARVVSPVFYDPDGARARG